MKLTKAQATALSNIERYSLMRGKPFNKEHANRTIFSVRQNVLERLRELGLIHSGGQFAFAFHTVTITDEGKKLLEASE